MTTMTLEKARIDPDDPLQCVAEKHAQKTLAAVPLGTVYSIYFQCFFEPLVTVGRHVVVRQYDPDEWPYSPEPDYQKDWDEAEE